MPPVIIVADDLSGACDSAAAFLGRAKTVRVQLQNAATELRPGSVLAFSTETRNLSSSNAVQVVENAVTAITELRGAAILFKKIDSAGRGHLAAETVAALRASGAALALVAPAFPAAHRTVLNGILNIRDSAQQQTTKDLPAMFPALCRDRVDLLPAGDEDELENAICRAMDHGTHVLLCDSENQQDLARLATVVYRIDRPILWTGSAGLARALAYLFPPVPGDGSMDRGPANGRTILFVGTDHPVTTLQLSHVEQGTNRLDCQVHRIQWNDQSVADVRTVFVEAAVASLILTGGDTAAFVLRALNAQAIRLAGELAPGIPWGFIEGGDAHDCIVVTKSGGFGQHDALAKAINFCTRRACEPA